MSLIERIDVAPATASAVQLIAGGDADKIKDKLRINGTDDDDLLDKLAVTATNLCANYMRRAITAQTVTVDFRPPTGYRRFKVPRLGSASLTSISGISYDRTVTALTADDYTLDTTYDELYPDSGLWPAYPTLKLVYVAGEADYTTVPQHFKDSVIAAIGGLYDNEELQPGREARGILNRYVNPGLFL